MKSFNEWLFSKKVKTKTDAAGWVSPEDITRIAHGVLLQNRKELDEFGHLDDRNKKRVREILDKSNQARPARLPPIEPRQKERGPSFYDKQQEREKEARRRAYNNPPSAGSGFPSYSGPG